MGKINSVTWCHGSCTKIEDITEIGDFSYSADAFVEPDPTDWPSACPLHCEFAPGQYATAIAKIDLYATIGLSEEHLMTYYIKSVYDEAHASGINDLNTATTTFSLNGRNLLYNFSNAAPRILNLYSIDGRLAASYTINSEVGTLSLGTLPTGSYIINLEANGRTIKSEKILLGR